MIIVEQKLGVLSIYAASDVIETPELTDCDSGGCDYCDGDYGAILADSGGCDFCDGDNAVTLTNNLKKNILY